MAPRDYEWTPLKIQLPGNQSKLFLSYVNLSGQLVSVTNTALFSGKIFFPLRFLIPSLPVLSI